MKGVAGKDGGRAGVDREDRWERARSRQGGASREGAGSRRRDGSRESAGTREEAGTREGAIKHSELTFHLIHV